MGLFLFSSIVIAEDYCYTYSDCQYWATLQNVDFVEGATANVTILYPNGTVFIDNDGMDYYGNGTFKYNVTHNISGNYIARTKYYNDSGIITVSSQSLTVIENEILTRGIMIAIIIGILGMAGLMLYASSQVKSEGDIVLSRAWEKILLYVGGLGFLAVGYNFMLVIVRNNPQFTYLVDPLQKFFVIFVIILFVITMNYGYHILKELTFNRLQTKERKEYED